MFLCIYVIIVFMFLFQYIKMKAWCVVETVDSDYVSDATYLSSYFVDMLILVRYGILVRILMLIICNLSVTRQSYFQYMFLWCDRDTQNTEDPQHSQYLIVL